MDDTAIDRKRKEQKNPSPSGSIKILFSIIKGRRQYFYIGGDTPKPRLIYERDCVDLASPLQNTQFGFATVCSKAYLVNQGKGKNDWLAALHYEDIDEQQPENTYTIQYLSPKIQSKDPKFKHQYFECFSAKYNGGGIFMSISYPEYTEQTESNGGSFLVQRQFKKTKNAFFDGNYSYMRSITTIFTPFGEEGVLGSSTLTTENESESVSYANILFYESNRKIYDCNKISVKNNETFSAANINRPFTDGYRYTRNSTETYRSNSTDIKIVSEDKTINDLFSKSVDIDSRYNEPVQALGTVPENTSSYSFNQEESVDPLVTSMFCGGNFNGLYNLQKAQKITTQDVDDGISIEAKLAESKIYVVFNKKAEIEYKKENMLALLSDITNKVNFTQVNLDFYRVNTAVIPIPDPPPDPLPPQVNIPVDIWTKSLDVPVDSYKEKDGEYVKESQPYKCFSLGFTDKTLPEDNQRMIHEYSFYPSKPPKTKND